MNSKKTIAFIIFFLVFTNFLQVFAQGSVNSSKLINKATVSQEDQIAAVLNQVKQITGMDFDKLASSHEGTSGHSFKIYLISGEKNIGNPETEEFLSQHRLLVNINSWPLTPNISWVVNQANSKKIREINMDGSIIEYDLLRSDPGTLLEPATVSIEDQVQNILKEVYRVTNIGFNHMIPEAILNDEDSGQYARAYRVENEIPKYNFSSGYFDEPKILSIGISRYPAKVHTLWNITWWSGANNLQTKSDGSTLLLDQRKLPTHWSDDFNSPFHEILTQASNVIGESFTDIIAQFQNDNVWVRAYATAGNNDYSKVLVATIVFENKRIKETNWSFLVHNGDKITSLNSDGSSTIQNEDY